MYAMIEAGTEKVARALCEQFRSHLDPAGRVAQICHKLVGGECTDGDRTVGTGDDRGDNADEEAANVMPTELRFSAEDVMDNRWADFVEVVVPKDDSTGDLWLPAPWVDTKPSLFTEDDWIQLPQCVKERHLTEYKTKNDMLKNIPPELREAIKEYAEVYVQNDSLANRLSAWRDEWKETPWCRAISASDPWQPVRFEQLSCLV